MASKDPITVSIKSKPGRIYLRTPLPSDSDRYYESYSNIDNVQYIPGLAGKGLTHQQCVGWIDRSIKSSGISSLILAILRTEDGEVIGDGGFQGINWEKKEAEIGIMMHPAAKGKGYAEEALKSMIGYGFQSLDLQTITMGTLEANTPFRNLVEKKLGVVGECRDNPEVGRECIYTIDRDSWQAE